MIGSIAARFASAVLVTGAAACITLAGAAAAPASPPVSTPVGAGPVQLSGYAIGGVSVAVDGYGIGGVA